MLIFLAFWLFKVLCAVYNQGVQQLDLINMQVFAISTANFKTKNRTNKRNCVKNFSIPNAFEREDEFVKSKSNQPSFQRCPGLFKEIAAHKGNPKWANIIARQKQLKNGEDEASSIFFDEYETILNSEAFLKLSGKTQVFSFPNRDLISTRNIHSLLVASNAEKIARYLGLNVDLARACALGHDLGHTPFGHDGEVALNNLMKKYNIQSDFWHGEFRHEDNSLRVLQDINTQIDPNGKHVNSDLTYGVRDGVVSHCGEVDENGIFPRDEYIDLRTIQNHERPQPYTMEGCVVKMSDRISYVGVDINDAIKSGKLSEKQLLELAKHIAKTTKNKITVVNNGNLTKYFLDDLMENSTPQKGINFSPEASQLMNLVKKFNYDHIYGPAKKEQVAEIDEVINKIFECLDELYAGKDTLSRLDKMALHDSSDTINCFKEWLIKYSDVDLAQKAKKNYANRTLYSIEDQNDYRLAIIEYIAGMTDQFARDSAMQAEMVKMI